MTKKPETLDCVAVKRRAQRQLAKALAGKSPHEQAETLHRLASQMPLWKGLAKSLRRTRTAVRAEGSRRSTG
jgi:hypothetical protein